MRFSTAVVAALPALALAAPAATVDCNGGTLTDEEQSYCGLVGQGIAPAAASYLAAALEPNPYSGAVSTLENDPAVAAGITSLVGTGTAIPTGLGPAFISVLQAQVTDIPSGSVRDYVSSVLAQGQAIDGGAAVTAAPSQSSGSSGSSSGSSGSSASGKSASASKTGASASGSTASASSSSVSKAGAAELARPTALGMAAAAVAGVVGLAVGL